MSERMASRSIGNPLVHGYHFKHAIGSLLKAFTGMGELIDGWSRLDQERSFPKERGSGASAVK